MKNLNELDAYRIKSEWMRERIGHYGDKRNGTFLIPYPLTGVTLRVIAASGGGWDHISISLPDRCPVWAEMEHVKRMFFKPEETAVQFHVPEADHINVHPYCLHLWRYRGKFPMPPKVYV